MRAYCPKCREYGGDEGENGWGIKQGKYGAVCKKCGGYVDVFE